jgi:hypothetical protein
MNVLPLFIDDWLSSPRIEAMDAAEERGYMRLLMRGAKNDGWLPADANLLAIWSRLGPQWNQETREELYRMRGITSGQKLLGCFEERDGRLYNERLTEVVAEWKKRQEHSAKALRSRWSENGESSGNPPGTPQTPSGQIPETDLGISPGMSSGISPGNTSHSHSHIENLESTLSPSPLSRAEAPPERWSAFLFAVQQAGMIFADGETGAMLRAFTALADEERQAAIAGIEIRIKTGEYADAHYIPRALRYLRERRWTARLRPGPQTSPKPPTRQERVRAAFTEAKESLRKEAACASG